MFRRDFIRLANVRIKEATILYKNGEFNGAYYLAGYAIECGLKACICLKTRQHEFPDKTFVNDTYTHDLKKLLKLAGLTIPPRIEGKWNTVKDWNENARYEIHTSTEAENLLNSIKGRNGILTWLKHHW